MRQIAMFNNAVSAHRPVFGGNKNNTTHYLWSRNFVRSLSSITEYCHYHARYIQSQSRCEKTYKLTLLCRFVNVTRHQVQNLKNSLC